MIRTARKRITMYAVLPVALAGALFVTYEATSTDKAQAMSYQECTGTVVSLGDTGDCVALIQTQMNNAIGAGLSVDGQFGRRTRAAVIQFQASRGIGADGVVGPITWGESMHR